MKALWVPSHFFTIFQAFHGILSQEITDGPGFVNQFPYDKIYQFVPSDAEFKGDLKILGSIDLAPTLKDPWLKNSKFRSKVSNGRIGPSFGGISLWSHFPWDNQNTYIRPGDVDRDIIIGDIGTNRIYFGSPTTNVNIFSNVTISGGSSVMNPTNWLTLFRNKGDGKNYIRGDTQLTGNLACVGAFSTGQPDSSPWTTKNIFKTKAGTGQSGAAFFGNKYASHFPWEDLNTYIRPGDENKNIFIGDIGNGAVGIGSATSQTMFLGQVQFQGGKSAVNPNNLDTFFNVPSTGMNYIRGDTEMRGSVWIMGNMRYDNGAKICVGVKCYDISKLALALDKF